MSEKPRLLMQRYSRVARNEVTRKEVVRNEMHAVKATGSHLCYARRFSQLIRSDLGQTLSLHLPAISSIPVMMNAKKLNKTATRIDVAKSTLR